MANINPYYVGSTLDTIGNNMSRDYATDAQLRAAELQARNQLAQIIQQATQAQANRQQQGGQFDQEMAYRQAALGQNNSQFGSNLDYMREALKAQTLNQVDARRQQGEQFNAEQAYRNAALAQSGGQFNDNLSYLRQALAQTGDLKGRELTQSGTQFDSNLAYMKEALAKQLAANTEGLRLQYPPERWKAEDSRVLSERIQQEGLLNRATADYNAKIDYENELAKSLSSQYNTILDPIKRAADEKAKDGWGWSTRGPSDESYRNVYRAAVDPEITRLTQALQGQPVTYNAATERFEPVLGRPRQMQQSQIPQQPQQGGLLGLVSQLYRNYQAGQLGAGQSNAPLAPAAGVADPIITVRDSTGKVFSIKGSNFPIARQRDPGIQLVQPGATTAPPTPAMNAASLIQGSGVNPQVIARSIINSESGSQYPFRVRDNLFGGVAGALGVQPQAIGSSRFSTSPGDVLLKAIRGGDRDLESRANALPPELLNSNALNSITNNMTPQDFELLKQIINGMATKKL